MANRIAHASHDENGKYKGGKAGDQTGSEVCIRTWYNRPWNYVIRCKDNVMREKIAYAMERACNNSKIGYDQNQRNTLLTYARKVGYDPGKVITTCETDCSALVTLACIYAGIKESDLYISGNSATTSTLRNRLIKTGKFEILTDSKYLKSSDYLLRGDILLYEGHHVAVTIDNGSKVNTNNTTTSIPSQSTIPSTSTNSSITINQFTPLKGNPSHFAEIIKNIKIALNTDYGLKFTIDSSINNILLVNLANVVLSTSAYKKNITYALQQLLRWWGYDITLDGVFENGTKSIILLFQSQVSIAQTGTTTKEFWYKILGK